MRLVPRIPVIEDLTLGQIPQGSNLLVEYDPASQWYNAHMTIAAGWLKTGGRIIYHIAAQPLDGLRSQLVRLGLNLRELETGGVIEAALVINDWYTATLGRVPQSTEVAIDSLKIADLSIFWGKGERETEVTHPSGPPGPVLRIVDNASCLARFNDERPWVEFILNRVIPRAQKWKQITIVGLIKGVHSEWVYKTLEGAVDGIMDFEVHEMADETQDLVRLRSMRTVGHDRRWHQIRIGQNFEIALDK